MKLVFSGNKSKVVVRAYLRWQIIVCIKAEEKLLEMIRVWARKISHGPDDEMTALFPMEMFPMHPLLPRNRDGGRLEMAW